MKYHFLTVLFAICSTLPLSAQIILDNDATPNSTVSVQPMDNEFNLKAGEKKDFRLFISNKTAKKMSFNVYLSDWHRDSVGTHVYEPVGTNPHSCSQFITFDKKFVEIDSGKVDVINASIQMPDSAWVDEEMRWSMIFIHSIEEAVAPAPTKEMISKIHPSIRFGVHVNQTPPAIKTQKDFKLISFIPMEGKKNVFRVVGENTGKVQLLCKSYIELSALADGKKTRLPIIEVPVFPGAKRYFDFELPSDLSKGKYTMVGVVDAGEDIDLLAAQLAINVE